jgi:AcrR family transcriptional regulator
MALTRARPEPRTRATRLQRARILAAAAGAAAEREHREVPVTAIVKRAGVTRTTFYSYFPSGECALLAAAQDSIARIGDAVRPAWAHGANRAESLRAALGALLAHLQVHPEEARFTLAFLLDPRSPEPRAHTLALLQRTLHDGARDTHTGICPPPLTAEVIVVGALAAIHERLCAGQTLADLLNPLMSTILEPYDGPAASARELARHAPEPCERPLSDPLATSGVRLTARTVRVLATIAAHPGASNVQIARRAGITNESQISKLLRRLEQRGLIAGSRERRAAGNRKAWTLTDAGRALDLAVTALAGPGR